VINLSLSVAIFLNFVPYFIKKIANSITSLKKDFKKDFKDDIKSGLGNILKRNYKYILITNTFTGSNRSLDGTHSDCQQITNLKK
jgi:hypothetical protein